MQTVYPAQTELGPKEIVVFNGNPEKLETPADLLVCSAFRQDYSPTFRSLIGLLYWSFGISVEALSLSPALDLRDLGVWISADTQHERFRRIACVEIKHSFESVVSEDEMRGMYDTLFFAVRKCAQRNIPVKSIAMPVLGTGDQAIALETSLAPLLTESISALGSIPSLNRILIFERDRDRYEQINGIVRRHLSDKSPQVAFISYSHRDVEIANLIANSLESNGVKPWIDHRMIRNPDYAEDIVKGISESKAFLLLVSSHSMQSKDVLREVRNASAYADSNGLLIWPLLLERVKYPNSFAYYLEGLDYTDLSEPPVQEKALRFCSSVHEKIRKNGSEEK